MRYVLFLIATVAAAQSWRPAPVTLKTTWGEKVTPDNAWREYPRPQFVRSRWQNLNGLWDYTITPQTAATPARYDGQMLVPYPVESSLSGAGRIVSPDQRLWQRRTFTIPAAWRGERILLHFGAVDYECVVWVNGAIAGAHKGGFDAFTFDITAFLKDGNNEILVATTDPSDTGEQPRGKQVLKPQGIWYTPVSGIWQTVWLEPVPATLHIAEVRLTPDVDAGGLQVAALANEATPDDTYAVRVTATAQGQTVASTILRVNRETLLPIPNAHLWSPSDPFLYDLKAELVRVKNPWPTPTQNANTRTPRFGVGERNLYAKATVEGAPLDTVTSYFGMRKISLGVGSVNGQPVMLLNGKAIFQHGPLDQGWWPDGLHTPPSDEAMRWEIDWLRQSGFNMLRKHIKVEPARYYYHCDKLGMLVWQDMPAGFNHALRNQRPDAGEPIRLSVSREQHELELRRMMGRLHNAPSIIMWVIHNEGWGQYESPALSRWVKAIDPSRLVNADSGWLDMNVGDLYDIHTYHPDPQQPSSKHDRAIVLGEYGGVGWPIADHLWNPNMRNWGYQTYQNKDAYIAALKKKVLALVPMKRELGVSAAVYTQTTDVEGEVNGLMTYDRKFIKAEPALLRELNKDLTGEK
ncbi:MAG: beta-galactosidase [Bryobacterales bacterium]|nr:beta-galactosidase [Bryobacterales bacterium]